MFFVNGLLDNIDVLAYARFISFSTLTTTTTRSKTMAWIQPCNLCKKNGLIINRELILCAECVEKIIKMEKARLKQIKKDRRKGIVRFS